MSRGLRRVAYVAAPYRASTPERIDWNIARAALVGRVAALEGWSPIVPHRLGAPVYGSDELALECGLALLYLVAADLGGGLFVLLDEHGRESPGVAAEVMLWRDRALLAGAVAPRGSAPVPRAPAFRGGWFGLEPRAVAVGLGSAWCELVEPPPDRHGIELPALPERSEHV